MNRREILAILGASICTTAPAGAEEDHSAHLHAAGLVVAGPVNGKLIDAASDCIKAGQACIAHCMASFAAGDTSLVACARIVDQMLSVCGTLQKLASAGSPRIADMAKVALAICDDCEVECRKHADHHATCKACAEACKACATECKGA
jgi:Cys-rich four helix bundle protein (predicted Tat secretion target)